MILAVSGCLLGENLRFDGGHKRDRFITDALSAYARFVSFCPEHLAFGSPRDSLRMVVQGSDTLFTSNKSGADLTKPLTHASSAELEKLKSHPLCGIILKSKSPSCGLGSAKLYLDNGFAEGKGDGLFASMCREAFPLLPIEEEGRLQDPWLRENFIMQLFAYDAFERFKSTHPTMKDLVAFHQSYKFMLQAKDEKHYRELGTVVGNQQELSFEELFQNYEYLFKQAIAHKSSIKKNRNVLEHMAGFLKKMLTDVEKATLHEQIKDYAHRIVPLIVPLSTLYLFAQKYGEAYLLGQKFLDPYPKELALRSDIRSGK